MSVSPCAKIWLERRIKTFTTSAVRDFFDINKGHIYMQGVRDCFELLLREATTEAETEEPEKMNIMQAHEEEHDKAQLRSDHSKMVKTLVKSDEQICTELTPRDCGLIHAAMGIAGEAGEIIDAVKKAAIYQKPLDVLNVIEELGDLEFYMEDLRSRINVTREETLRANMNKLAVRYNNFKYSDKAAQDRADKA